MVYPNFTVKAGSPSAPSMRRSGGEEHAAEPPGYTPGRLVPLVETRSVNHSDALPILLN